MLHSRHHRGFSLSLALLLVGGLLVVLPPTAAAQNPFEKSTTSSDLPQFKLSPKATPDVAELTKAINDKLEAGWKANKITPSRPVDDYEFIRRVSLDLIGRIATPEEIEQYLKDPPETRRALLIDRLLDSDDYPRHWANMWANWLLSRAGTFGKGKYHERMEVWLEAQIAENVPYNKMVEQLVTATGRNTENGAANFLLAHTGEENPQPKRGAEGRFEMIPVTSRITRLFLGIQVQCAQCHDHPFVKAIQQKHFWGINAYLRQVDQDGAVPRRMRPGDELPDLILKDNVGANKDAVVFFEKRNGLILQTSAEFLPSGDAKRGKALPPNTNGVDRRRELSNALLEHDQFPRAIVNRMWAVFFGRGFVHPVDDFSDNNQPSNPELLNELAGRFKHYGYDTKKLIRWICNSNAYHLSFVANKTNADQEKEGLFSRMLLKAMSPEQLFESLMVATNAEAIESKEAKEKLKKEWLGSLITNFGDDEGNEVTFNGTIVQALMMMNGKDINDAITRDKKGTVALSMAAARTPDEAITKLYMATLNRKPSSKELTEIKESFPLVRPAAVQKDAKEPAAKYHDLLWALLNSNEFLLNH